MRFFGLRIGVTIIGLAALVAASGDARAEIDLWPLVEISDETTTILFPFYVRDRQSARIVRLAEGEVEVDLGGDEVDRVEPGGELLGLSYDELAAHGPGPLEVPDFLMVFPWYYRTHYGRDHHVVWPLFKLSDGRVARVAPLYFGSENRFTLLPLIHRTPDHTFWSIPPAYWRRNGSFQAVFPLYAQFEDELITFPWYYRSRDSQSKVDSLLPFFHYQRDAFGSRFTSLLFGRWTSPSSSTTWGPLYLRTLSPEVSRIWYFPLWLSTEKRHPDFSSSWSSFLWLYERKDAHWRDGSLLDERRTFLFFLFGKVTQPNRSAIWGDPIFYYERGQDPQHFTDVSRTWLFPFWLSTRKTTPDDESLSWYSILWPLFAREETRSRDGSLLERRRSFLFFSDHLDREGRRTFKVLGFPVLERM
jgi:hypothetical protein